MNVYRTLVRAIASQRVAHMDPRYLASLLAAAQDSWDTAPIGDHAEAVEPEMGSGVLVFQVRGTIVHHWTDGFDSFGMVTPTDWLVDALNEAATNEAVRGVVLDIDSGGGMAVGTPEAAEAIYRFRDVKPIWAVANGGAYSAAYYLAAAAGRLLVTPSGGVGSIGTLTMHEDITEMLANIGVKVEILRATEAENKARFNPFESLTDEERAVVVEELDTRNGQFLSDVARYRGMEPESVAEVSELGRTFLAPAAVAIGLADGVMTLRDAVAEMSAMVGVPPETDGGTDVGARSGAGVGVEVRNLGADQGSEVRTAGAGGKERLEGSALNYGSLSADMGGWQETFEPGAFAGSIAEDDLRVIWQHDPRCVFGRVKAGTARIWEDGGTVRYTAEPPDAQWARDAMESVRRGDVDQNSFKFRVFPGGQRWERRGGMDTRIISKAQLMEVGPQTNPAYTDTTAAVRSLEAWRGSDEYGEALRVERVASAEIYTRRAALRGRTL
jgi:HK97 family phage prohead protease